MTETITDRLESALARLEALEKQRDEEQREAQRREEIQVQTGKKLANNKKVHDLGTKPGAVRCSNEDCDEWLSEIPAEFTGTRTDVHYRDMKGNVQSGVENSHTHWVLKDGEKTHCGSCSEPLNWMPPGTGSTLKLRGTEKQRYRRLRDAEMGIQQSRSVEEAK